MNKKKLRLKKFNLHPVVTFIILTFLTIIVSWILSAFDIQILYNQVNKINLELETKILSVENLFNYKGIKYIISTSAKNFMGFTPLTNLLISFIGISVAYASGLIDAFTKRITSKIDNRKITFLVIFIATISSIINDVGYVILIPLAALIFKQNRRNPLLGIIAAFCGISFGYGATIFVGSSDINLISDTTAAARLISSNYHVQLTSNLIIMIASTIILSIVGTFIIEKIIAPKIAKQKQKEFDGATKEINILEIKETEHNKLEVDLREKKGLRKAFIVSIIFILLLGYSIIPNLPFSGLLLDMSEKTYLKQLFGNNSYFYDGFTFIVSMYFVFCGISYGKGAKTFKNINDLINKCANYLGSCGTLIFILFFSSLFIATFKKSNIGNVIVAFSTKLISELSFSGISLIIIVMILIAICSIFITTPNGKWAIMAPVVVPLMMQSNISPQFSQFILRASDSMTKGITPLLGYFAIYIGYLNIYNSDDKPITIKKAISYIVPYFSIIAICWILIIIGWYILGAPIGIGVNSTL